MFPCSLERPHIGHVAIRNRGTIGGSIAHADASAELPAVALVTEAEMVVRGPAGERVVTADGFFRGHFTTTLADDECLVEVRLPATEPDAGWSFQEVARRHGDFALVGAAAMVARAPRRGRAGPHLPVRGRRPPPSGREAEAALVGRGLGRPTSAAVGRRRPDLDPPPTPTAPPPTGATSPGSWSARRSPPPPSEEEARHDRAEPGCPVNGAASRPPSRPRLTLADLLREELGLTGTHLGCEHGVCGACTVLLDGEAVRSCLILAVQADGREVRRPSRAWPTATRSPRPAGVPGGPRLPVRLLHPGLRHLGDRCLRRTRRRDEEIREALSGNICRCTGYQSIVRAVRAAAGEHDPDGSVDTVTANST